MKTTHISPEYKYNDVYGTLSMLEKKSFLSSKLIKYEKNLNILNENIIYYQNVNNEQLNLNTEITLPYVLYNTVDDKKNNSVLSQNNFNNDLYNDTKWILTIDVNTILFNYIFANLKKYRTFENVTNNITLYNDVNFSIKEYINKNLMYLYSLTKIEIFLKYNDLNVSGNRLKNLYEQSIDSPTNLTNRYNVTTDAITKKTIINFNQEKNSSNFSFNYYYNLYFTKQ
jgi:hypothetical protein